MISKKTTLVLQGLSLFIIITVFFCFLPYKNMVSPLNSDSAIPIIMAQNPHPSIYSFFYYGQNRFGAYPFVFVFLISKILNFTATAITIYSAAFTYLIVSLLNLAKTINYNKLFIIIVFLFMNFIFPKFSYLFFSIDIVYIWQISSLILYANFLIKSIKNNGSMNLTYYLLCILFSFLASSSNPITMPYLFSLTPLIYIFRKNIARKIPSKKFTFFYFMSFLPSFLLEEIIKNFYNYSNQNSFGKNFSNPLEQVDLHNFFSHLIEQSIRLFSTAWLLIITVVVFSNIFLLKKKGKINYTSAIFFILAGVNFMICLLSQYVSSNAYAIRYFIPTYCFLLLSFSFCITDLYFFMKVNKILIHPFLIISMTFISLAYINKSRVNLEIEKIRWQSQTLAQLYPQAILWGQYWDVYLIRGLQNNLNTASHPIPMNGDYNRTLWDLCRLDVGKYIIVAARSNFEIIKNNKMILDKTGNFITNFDDYGFKFSLEKDKRLTDLNLPFQRYKIVSGKRSFSDIFCR